MVLYMNTELAIRIRHR